MTKLLESIQRTFTGQRVARQRGLQPMDVIGSKECLRDPEKPWEEIMRLEVRLMVTGSFPAREAGISSTPETRALEDNLKHLLIHEVYGEISHELRTLMVKVGEMDNTQVRATLGDLIDRMEGKAL